MTAKDFLRQYEYADRRVKRLEEELEEERLMIDAARSPSDNDGMPHGNGISKPVEDRAVRLADKLKALSDARLDAIEARQAVFDVIIQIDGDVGDVLYQRYIKLLYWTEVCVALGKGWNWTHQRHREGLELVEKIIKEY